MASKDAELILLYLTAIYYDCYVNLYVNDKLKIPKKYK